MSFTKRSGPLCPGVAFVRGARGLGNAIAESFAREGARGVVIVDIQDDKTFEAGAANVTKYGTECLVLKTDVTDEKQVEEAIAKTVEKFGRIDYCANFAGIVGPIDSPWEVDYAQFKKVIDVNLNGVWLCNKHQVKQMMKQDSIEVEEGRPQQRGAIVNCASVNSIMSNGNTDGYTAAKHGVNGITKSVAVEARKHGIRVNSVSPGFLRTQMVAKYVTQTDGKDDPTWLGYEARQGRKATFNEIGDAVAMMCTPRMSLVSAHNLVCDYGFTNTY